MNTILHRKTALICSAILVFVSNVYSQTGTTTGAEILQSTKIVVDSTLGWKKGGNTAINFSQVSLTNWAAGGQSSLSIATFLSVFANYKTPNSTWDNKLDLAYGLLQQGRLRPFKSDDRIEFGSKYGRLAKGNWYYSALFNFRTQFDVGFKSPIDYTVLSRFLSPAYIIGAIGFDYKEKSYFTFFVAPLTNKTTIVRDKELSAQGAYGVDTGKIARYEVGGFIRAGFTKDVFQNVTVTANLDLFSNYFKNPENIDVNLNTLIVMKVNKYLSASIATQLIYDDDILIPLDLNKDGILDAAGKRIQFKEVLGIGLSYKF